MVGTQEAMTTREQAPLPQMPPPVVVALAVLVGAALVGGTSIGGYLLIHNNERLEGAPHIAIPAKMAEQEKVDDRRSALAGATCPSPCSGGLACRAKPVECTSGLSCVPGLGTEPLADTEGWALHLSAVQEVDQSGRLVDPCKSQKDFWVCRNGTTLCASQADACAHHGKSVDSIPVVGVEFGHAGLTLDIHLGDPTGPVIATTSPIRSLLRGGLCRGFAVAASGGDIARVSYFVLPP